MKKIVSNLLIFVTVAAVFVILLLSLGTDEGARYVYKGNQTYTPVTVKPGQYQCSECNMDVEDTHYMAELIATNGDTYFFDDIGCMVLWLKNHHLEIHKVFTQTLDTNQWVEAKNAWYTRTAASPMGYGFGAYENQQSELISYEDMKLLMLQGKHLHDPFVKKSLLQ